MTYFLLLFLLQLLLLLLVFLSNTLIFTVRGGIAAVELLPVASKKRYKVQTDCGAVGRYQIYCISRL